MGVNWCAHQFHQLRSRGDKCGSGRYSLRGEPDPPAWSTFGFHQPLRDEGSNRLVVRACLAVRIDFASGLETRYCPAHTVGFEHQQSAKNLVHEGAGEI